MVSELSNIAPEQGFMLITKGHMHNVAMTKITLKDLACQRIEEVIKSKKLRVKFPPNNFILADAKPMSDTHLIIVTPHRFFKAYFRQIYFNDFSISFIVQ